MVRVLALACLVGGCERPPGPYTGPARHVVFVSLDTTRADHFGFYGSSDVSTPEMDAFAEEAIVLEDLGTVVTTTLASHTSLFTGNHPHRHGVPRNAFIVSPDNVMLAEVLGERGFLAAGFIGGLPLSRSFAFPQGFTYWDEELDVAADEHHHASERTAQSVTDRVLGWLDAEGVPENLFLFVHYFDPHVPYEAPAPWDTLYDPRGREGLPSWNDLARTRNCSGPGDEELVERFERQYAGEISYLDHHLGRLFDGLRRHGILDEALVVVTSDHGEHFNEHPVQPGAPVRVCFDHGWVPHRETTRIVGVVRLPGALHGGHRVEERLSNIDLFPTVLDWLEIDLPAPVDGTPFDWTRPFAEERTRFTQVTKPWETVELDPRWRNLLKPRSIEKGRFKYWDYPYSGLEDSTSLHAELYDLEQDPDERNNLLENPTPEHQRIAAELRSELEGWAFGASPLPEKDVEDPDVRAMLRSLGYL